MLLTVVYNGAKCRWEVPVPFQPRKDFRAVDVNAWKAVALAVEMGAKILRERAA